MRRWLSVLILIAAPVIAWAADSYQVNHGASLNITEHSTCRKVTNNHASGLPLFVPTKTSTEWSAFYGSTIPGVTIETCGITPGSQNYTTAGSHNFVVPAYNTLTVYVWGGGGGGGGYPSNAGNGGNSSFNGTVIGGGGIGAYGRTCGSNNCYYGTGGSASGGDTNTAGNNGAEFATTFGHVSGGSAPSGGTGGLAGANSTSPGGNGNPPGAGGGGGGYAGGGCFYVVGCISWAGTMAGGGSGAYAVKAYSAGQLTVGASIPVVVGTGGTGTPPSNDDYSTYYQSGNGAVGRVYIVWN